MTLNDERCFTSTLAIYFWHQFDFSQSSVERDSKRKRIVPERNESESSTTKHSINNAIEFYLFLVKKHKNNTNKWKRINKYFIPFHLRRAKSNKINVINSSSLAYFVLLWMCRMGGDGETSPIFCERNRFLEINVCFTYSPNWVAKVIWKSFKCEARNDKFNSSQLARLRLSAWECREQFAFISSQARFTL